ncbi:response regulator [Tsuneonella flava]|uniref:response regulator n=1 Tax=Tsuneonella flava TaxID=2055955 RepID=UPI001F435A0B|nr:response regulator transcription factor [Tsuneonella flava]
MVDDELAIQRLVATILARGGHEALVAASATAALAIAGRKQPDAAIVDLGLPDRDGLELVAAMRKQGGFPILVLSARTEVSDKIAALDLGADDYVTKPFDGDELLARLRSALRRSGSGNLADASIMHGPITIDRSRRQTTVAEREVSLTPREFDVLEMLVAAGGCVLTHRQLLEKVWGKAHADDVEYLRVVIRALRLKVEENPSQPSLIRNEPGIGYRLT